MASQICTHCPHHSTEKSPPENHERPPDGSWLLTTMHLHPPASEHGLWHHLPFHPPRPASLHRTLRLTPGLVLLWSLLPYSIHSAVLHCAPGFCTWPYFIHHLPPPTWTDIPGSITSISTVMRTRQSFTFPQNPPPPSRPPPSVPVYRKSNPGSPLISSNLTVTNLKSSLFPPNP